MPDSESTLVRALSELAALGTDRDHEQLAALQDRLDAARLRVLVAGEAKRIVDAALMVDALTDDGPAGDELAGRVWELRHNVTPCDAAYLALAEARGCRLVTTDGKLRDCPGRRCDVRVVTPGR